MLQPQASKAAEITAGKCEVDFDFNPRGTERDSRARAFIIANKAAYSAGHSESVVTVALYREWAGEFGDGSAFCPMTHRAKGSHKNL